MLQCQKQKLAEQQNVFSGSRAIVTVNAGVVYGIKSIHVFRIGAPFGVLRITAQ